MTWLETSKWTGMHRQTSLSGSWMFFCQMRTYLWPASPQPVTAKTYQIHQETGVFNPASGLNGISSSRLSQLRGEAHWIMCPKRLLKVIEEASFCICFCTWTKSQNIPTKPYIWMFARDTCQKPAKKKRNVSFSPSIQQIPISSLRGRSPPMGFYHRPHAIYGQVIWFGGFFLSALRSLAMAPKSAQEPMQGEVVPQIVSNCEVYLQYLKVMNEKQKVIIYHM